LLISPNGKEREQRLEQLVAELEESNERLEQFAYAASHDLQEPLRMVSSYLQLIDSRYDLDEEGEEFLEFAVDGAERMRSMIDGLLKYSRVETQGDPLETVDLEHILDDVRENLQVTIEENDVMIEAEPLPRVQGDPDQLRQVFQNLLDNAIEYSDVQPTVRVTAEERTARTGSSQSRTRESELTRNNKKRFLRCSSEATAAARATVRESVLRSVSGLSSVTVETSGSSPNPARGRHSHLPSLRVVATERE